jgi:hypothetical protein
MGMNARVCESSGLGGECMGGSQWETKRVFEGAVMDVKVRACRGSDGKRVYGMTAMNMKASALKGRDGVEASVCEGSDVRGNEFMQGPRRARKRVSRRTAMGVKASEC